MSCNVVSQYVCVCVCVLCGQVYRNIFVQGMVVVVVVAFVMIEILDPLI